MTSAVSPKSAMLAGLESSPNLSLTWPATRSQWKPPRKFPHWEPVPFSSMPAFLAILWRHLACNFCSFLAASHSGRLLSSEMANLSSWKAQPASTAASIASESSFGSGSPYSLVPKKPPAFSGISAASTLLSASVCTYSV